MQYWAIGWSCYAVALVAVLFTSRVPVVGPLLLFAYFAFEYAAVFMIFAGCRYTATDQALGRRWLAARGARSRSCQGPVVRALRLEA